MKFNTGKDVEWSCKQGINALLIQFLLTHVDIRELNTV